MLHMSISCIFQPTFWYSMTYIQFYFAAQTSSNRMDSKVWTPLLHIAILIISPNKYLIWKLLCSVCRSACHCTRPARRHRVKKCRHRNVVLTCCPWMQSVLRLMIHYRQNLKKSYCDGWHCQRIVNRPLHNRSIVSYKSDRVAVRR